MNTSTPEMDAAFQSEAMKVLELWEKTHDWSQRPSLWGSSHGYRGLPRSSS